MDDPYIKLATGVLQNYCPYLLPLPQNYCFTELFPSRHILEHLYLNTDLCTFLSILLHTSMFVEACSIFHKIGTLH